MKKLRIVVLTFVIIFVMAVFAPVPARADNDDFEVEFQFWPEVVGYNGADIQLRMAITNTGSTDINRVDININTNDGFTYSHEGISIEPHRRMRLSTINIPFTSDDLNTQKWLQVAINNDDFPNNPDGVQMFPFEIEGTHDIFDIDWRISPEQETYQVGDTVTVTHEFTFQLMDYGAENPRAGVMFVKDGTERVSCSGIVTSEELTCLGESVVNSFEYTFCEDDVGDITTHYSLDYELTGHFYIIEGTTAEFTVEEAPEMNFAAQLSAEPTVIDAGDTVTFEVGIKNVGPNIEMLEVCNIGGATEAMLEDLPTGESGKVWLDVPIYETCDVSYVVIARIGDTAVSKETNSVHITVRDPAVSAETPAPTETASPSPAVQTPTGTASPSPAVQTQPSASASPTSEDQAAAAGAQEDMPAGLGTGWIILIIGLSLVALAAIAVVVILLLKNRKQKTDVGAE